MSNPIRKLIQLVLDKRAADKAEKDAKKSLGGVEKGLNRLKKVAIAVGVALAAAFSIRAIVRFGKEAIRQARESEKEWSKLAGTVENAGVEFRSVEKDLRALADAWEQATVHGDDEFASTLQRLTILTGDYSASVQNMGLVANVAAAFFDGNLAPAAEMVGKVMTGNISVLQRMGIQAENAQEALEILAQRSMGAATKATETLDGKLKQITVQWANFQKAVGFAMIGTGEMTGALDVLIGAIMALTAYVTENADVINRWVVGAIDFAITAIDALYRALVGLAKLLSGTVLWALGVGTRALVFFTDVQLKAARAVELFARILGGPLLQRAVSDNIRKLEELTEALKEFERTAREAGGELLGEGVDLFGRRVIPSIRDMGGAAAPGDFPELFGPPALAAGAAGTGEGDAGGGAGSAANEAKDLLEIWRQYPGVMLMVAQAQSDAATQTERLATATEALNQQMQVSPKNAALIAEAMDEWAEAAKRVERQMAVAGEVAEAVGDIMFGALGSGVGEMAKYKAKQNAIMAAEQLAMGIVASLNPLTAPLAGKHYAAAAKFSAIATAWGTLAGAFGAFGGGGGGAGATRDVGGAAAARAQPPGAEVHIYFDGPGFDAVNPTVQRVLAGAAQIYGERYGPNAKVQTHRRR